MSFYTFGYPEVISISCSWLHFTIFINLSYRSVFYWTSSGRLWPGNLLLIVLNGLNFAWSLDYLCFTSWHKEDQIQTGTLIHSIGFKALTIYWIFKEEIYRKESLMMTYESSFKGQGQSSWLIKSVSRTIAFQFVDVFTSLK